jgi:hypothetical protein
VVGEGNVHSIAIVGSPVGRQGVNYVCMQVFFDKTTPVAKKATNRNHQSMLNVIQCALMVTKL